MSEHFLLSAGRSTLGRLAGGLISSIQIVWEMNSTDSSLRPFKTCLQCLVHRLHDLNIECRNQRHD